MIFPLIRCYQGKLTQQPLMFYILSKGTHAGKPSLQPWANCFEVVCQNQQYFEFYFWLFHALYKAQKFKMHIRGSVIPFLCKEDIRITLLDMAPLVFSDWLRFQEIIKAMEKLEKIKCSLQQQVIDSEKLQIQLMDNYFRSL